MSEEGAGRKRRRPSEQVEHSVSEEGAAAVPGPTSERIEATVGEGGAYRRLLRVYPHPWRAAHGEAYVGVMLDVADAAGRTRPTVRERLSTWRHAASVWRPELERRGAADPAVASLRWAGPAALVGGSVLAVLCLVLGEVPAVLHPGDGMFHVTWMLVLGPLWLAALAAALAGGRRAARVLLATAATLPLPVTALTVARLGGAMRDGQVIHLFPGPADLVGRLLPSSWLTLVTGTKPPLGIVALSSICAAGAALAGPPRTDRGRRRAVWAVGAGVVGALVLLVRSPLTPVLHVGVFGPIYNGGLGGLAAPVLVGVAAATVAGLVVLLHRPGALLAVTVVGWPWAVAVLLAESRLDVVTGGMFPWSLPAFAVVLAPGATGLGLTAAVAAQRLRHVGSVTT